MKGCNLNQEKQDKAELTVADSLESLFSIQTPSDDKIPPLNPDIITKGETVSNNFNKTF